LSMTNHLIFLVTGKNKIDAFNQWQNNKDLPASLVCAKESIKILSFDLV
jgi:6-phosphogluconolactonase/glucosamine-6-phosphate isomerase/deaminase